MSLRDDLLPVLDDARALLADLEIGQRLWDVVMRVRVWDGPRVGMGNPVDTDTPLTLDAAGRRVKMKLISSRELMASGGKYEDGDFRIGPFTPTYAGGGRDPSYFNPAVATQPTEILFQINGPDMDHVWCRLVNTDTAHSWAYSFVLRRTNVTP